MLKHHFYWNGTLTTLEKHYTLENIDKPVFCFAFIFVHHQPFMVVETDPVVHIYESVLYSAHTPIFQKPF